LKNTEELLGWKLLAGRWLSSKIQSIKAAARGFRSFRNYRIRILFFCGKLDLYPL
jgi:hypothetical protein